MFKFYFNFLQVTARPICSLLVVIIFISSCDKITKSDEDTQILRIPVPEMNRTGIAIDTLDFDLVYNRILGMLLGSAIGDAMGAPTEMWSRKAIQSQYGYINSLIPVVREPSAEGTWDYNLPPGGTTDDTRWKVLTADYLIEQKMQNLSAAGFAEHIVARYSGEIDTLKSIDSFEPLPFEDRMRRIGWLQEFALVARPYTENNTDAYIKALNKFYGGEMSCAGMLFSPALAVCYPGDPGAAYELIYDLDIYDIGNANDMSALTGAMVAAALAPDATPDKILAVLRDVDPKSYFKSRLVGRTAYALLQDARAIVFEAAQTDSSMLDSLKFAFDVQSTGRDSLFLARQQAAYELLDEANWRVPWHPAEIHLINLTALVFSDFDFQIAMEFVINFGRDNDTVGAVTGAIIGAMLGVDGLPQEMIIEVLISNRKLGIDLEEKAYQLTKLLVKQQLK